MLWASSYWSHLQLVFCRTVLQSRTNKSGKKIWQAQRKIPKVIKTYSSFTIRYKSENPATPYAEPVQRLCQLHKMKIAFAYYVNNMLYSRADFQTKTKYCDCSEPWNGKRKQTRTLVFQNTTCFLAHKAYFIHTHLCFQLHTKVKKKFLSTLNEKHERNLTMEQKYRGINIFYWVNV